MTTISTREEIPRAAGLATGASLPSWLMSLVVHLSALTVLSIYLQPTPRGIDIEPTRTGGIVLASASGGAMNYLEEGEEAGTSNASTAASPAAFGGSALPELTEQPLNSGPQLPTGDGSTGFGALPGDLQRNGLPGATGMTQGSGGTGKRGIGDSSQAETSVFGVSGRGSRFVYVFDRSASMSGYEGRPLSAAKRELLASLQSLERVHQFQVIFYNDRPHLMNLNPGQQPQLVFADDQGKRLASTFVGGVVADGGTRHIDALLMAIQMRPDVIFFLTDADEPRLSAVELRKIRDRSRGVSINTIEFGSGPSSGRYTFLRQLADENNGKHAYVDVTSLPLQ
ncbi:hypothetical protein ETAA8_60020 [Anatilimnocola aggregata]|uniref:VWFA domain-containing protein n=1 Tax=Anatilimnocola aggregata TaxID=2528021 RepID=A0A517YKW2_9BACT|nr:hypothetical protein [Anatilimnocola aggregata]QDU30853.1 hypothetical protein ETAA8_60020 [Anatilimnocola aggregata]